jgi:hypothetical protein
MYIIFVLPNTTKQIVGYANVKGSVLFACHDVNVVGFHCFLQPVHVIPAQAGIHPQTFVDSRLRGNDTFSRFYS